MSILKSHDSLLAETGAAAIVLREKLVPVEGPDGVLFPPTFAPGDGFPGGYNIDGDPNGRNICLVDSIGSQANRLEPLFRSKALETLVPQISIRVGNHRIVHLLDAGHRAGDAIVRCSSLQEELQLAFRALLGGDAEPLAKIAPTSLVFGVWDSRGTQAKAPRLIASTIRAYDVRRLTRSAQYIPPIDYIAQDLLDPPKDKSTQQTYSERGFVHIPATATPGGVIATGGIRREATLTLSALRMLRAAQGPDRSLALQRYLLGLALVAITAHVPTYLRQGCNLVLEDEAARQWTVVYGSGKRQPFSITHTAAIEFANAAAREFGVGADRDVPFERSRAQRDLTDEGGKRRAWGTRTRG